MSNIGLVLSGGMAKGAYQIGALSALREYFRPCDFKYVSAASIGVLNTYAFLTDNLKKAKEIWLNLNVDNERKFIMSMLKGEILRNIISEMVISRKILQPFYIPLLDVKGRDLKYYNLENLEKSKIQSCLNASVSLPLYTKGECIDNIVYYDGAVIDNIPIYPILDLDKVEPLDYIIVIYFDDYNYLFENPMVDRKVIKLTFPDNKRIMNSIQVKHESIVSMIDMGYNRTKEVLDFIFVNGVNDIEQIQNQIYMYNQEKDKLKARITGDVIVTNMNKVMQRLVKREGVNT